MEKMKASSICNIVGSVLSPVYYLGTRVKMRSVFGLSRPRGLVLDCGCGFGPYAHEIGPEVYVGIDLNRYAIKTAHYRCREHTFLACDAQHLPLRNDVFQFSICSDVLEHVEDDTRVLPELHRVIRSSGELVITVPMLRKECVSSCKGQRGKPYVGHVRDGYLHEEMLCMLSRAKFRVVKTKFYYGAITDRINTLLLRIVVRVFKSRHDLASDDEQQEHFLNQFPVSLLSKIYLLVFPFLLLTSYLDVFLPKRSLKGMALLAMKVQSAQPAEHEMR